MIKDARLVAVYGRRGSGKSTRVKALTRACRRLIVFDPRDEYAIDAGLARFDRLRAMFLAIKRRWSSGFRLAFVPEAGREPEQLHDLVTALWRAQRPYEQGRDGRKITLVVEEMDLSYPVRFLPASMQGMTRVCNQGRHVGIDVIGVTQRPAQISATFRGNISEAYIFPLARADDRREILGMIGQEYAEQLRRLPDHHYLRYENGTVTTGKNRIRPL